MKRYSKYKPTGIEWIGEIPEHWKVEKLKRILSDRLKYGANEAAELDDRNLPRYIRITDFDDKGKLKEETFKSLPMDLASDYLLQEGDVLFARSGATVGKTFIFKDYKGVACFAGYLIRARANTHLLFPEFLNYYTKSEGYTTWKNNIFTQSTIQNIGADKYQYLPLPLPLLPEQKAIADYLDKTTKEIDAVIEIKEKQIETIEQYFRSKLHEVVTGGLNLNVKRKPSGVDWIGEIPEHWKVERIKDICLKFYGGGTPNTNVEEYWKNGTIPWVSPKDMKSMYIIETEDYINELAIQNSATNLVPIGSLLVVIRSGILKHTLPVSINKVIVTINQDLKALILLNQYHNKFIYYSLLSYSSFILSQTSKVGATVDSIETKDFLSFKIIFPDISEQKAIAEYLDKLREKVESITAVLREQVEVLKNYRKSLIHECVTGKRKVV